MALVFLWGLDLGARTTMNTPNPLNDIWDDLNGRHEAAKKAAQAAQEATKNAQAACDNLNTALDAHIKALREAFKL
jgi:hypothetical protein